MPDMTSKTILAVDDECDIVNLIKHTLEVETGIQVCVFTDALAQSSSF
jgi:PleD family two-component response regulator